MKIKRTNISQSKLDAAMQAARTHLAKIIKKHGLGMFASPAELLGVIELEMIELKTAMQARDGAQVEDELLDIAIACIFGLACLKGGNWYGE